MSKEKEVKKEKFVLAFSAIGLADVSIYEKDFVAAAMYVKKAKYVFLLLQPTSNHV